MAEHGLLEPVIGVTLDGAGYGLDGAVWGGEFLVGDYQHFRRAAHLRYVRMPGGEKAIREPWRMALAHLVDADLSDHLLRDRAPAAAVSIVRKAIDRELNSPLTSSTGRLFDAVTVLAGACDRVTYEGQAASQLEWLATGVMPDGAYPFDLQETIEDLASEATLIIDTRPTIRAVAQDAERGIDSTVIARRFHSTLADLIVTVCARLRRQTGLTAVVLSGGVFMNALLTSEVHEHLGGLGFRVYSHNRVPPNDGGLSLGQVAIAAQRLLCTSQE